MKPREFMTFGALFYLVLSDVYGLFRQRVILTGVRKYSHTFEELFSLQWEFFLIGMRMFEKIYNKKGNLIMKFPFLFRIEKFGLLVSSFFFDSAVRLYLASWPHWGGCRCGVGRNLFSPLPYAALEIGALCRRRIADCNGRTEFSSA